jgi:hypothetical protein
MLDIFFFNKNSFVKKKNFFFIKHMNYSVSIKLRERKNNYLCVIHNLFKNFDILKSI